MSEFFQRKIAVILALALSLAVSLIVLATDTELRDRLGMTYWILGLAIIGSILLVLAGYVWDRTMMDRLREVNRNAKQQADLAAKETDSSSTDDDEDFALEQDEIMGVARQIERMAKSLQKMETSYRGIVEDQVDLICRYKSNGFLTFTNSSYSKFLGKTRSELVGQRFPIFDLGYPKRDIQGNLPDRASFEVELVPIDSADTVSYQWTHRRHQIFHGDYPRISGGRPRHQ